MSETTTIINLLLSLSNTNGNEANHTTAMNGKYLIVVLIGTLLLATPARAQEQPDSTLPKLQAMPFSIDTVGISKNDGQPILRLNQDHQDDSTKLFHKPVIAKKSKSRLWFENMVEEKKAKERALRAKTKQQAYEYLQQLPPAQRPETHTYVHRNIRNLKLDVWHPAKPRDDRACVIYLFAGGFFSGSRNDSASIAACRALSEQGFVAISIDYRRGLNKLDLDTVTLKNIVNPFKRSINEAVEDLCDAIAFVCEHADELNIDTSRIVLTGSSAGAITVLQTDYARVNKHALVAALPPSFEPLAVIAYAGAIMTTHGRLHYNSAPAPTFLLHGTLDKIVNYKGLHPSFSMGLYGSHKIARQLKKMGNTYWIYRYRDRGHEVHAYLPETIDEFTLFVDMACKRRITYCDATFEDKELPQAPNANDNIFDLYLGD